MSETVSIQGLSDDAIRRALREALRSETAVRAACDFVSAVDWSGLDTADSESVRLLGELEQLTTDIIEDVISVDAFLNRVGQLAMEALELPAELAAPRSERNSAAPQSTTKLRIGPNRDTERIALYA